MANNNTLWVVIVIIALIIILTQCVPKETIDTEENITAPQTESQSVMPDQFNPLPTQSENTPSNCFDGIDNDNDGLTDIFDPECFAEANKDYDGDGWSNGDEYELGTDINNPNSFPGSCKDSDGDNPHTPGIVLTTSGSFSDSCIDRWTVREYTCVNGLVSQKTYYCPNINELICDGGTEKFCQT